MEHGRLNVKQSDFKNVEFLIILSILKEKFAKFWVLQLPRKMADEKQHNYLYNTFILVSSVK